MTVATEGEPRERLRLGISACLLGQKVRYDGGHKQDRWVTDVLGRCVDFVPVCPEVEIGLGTPRPTIRLERYRGAVHLIAPGTRTDHTATMRAYAASRATGLAEQRLSGYIFKKDSPSCGMERVRVHDRDGGVRRDGQGFFAAALLQEMPALPAEEEGRLDDPRLRENFVTRVFAHWRWLGLQRAGPTRARLFRFHAIHKYVLMARNQAALRQLGHLLGDAGKRRDVRLLADAYLQGFAAAMARVPSPKGHANVLQHLAGYVSPHLDAGDRAELAATIETYRLGRSPLVVPVTLLRHHARRLGATDLLDQVYLSPHPSELMLLNHV